MNADKVIQFFFSYSTEGGLDTLGLRFKTKLFLIRIWIEAKSTNQSKLDIYQSET